ncbi:portal protein [Mycobacterium phage Kumao]|uniref:Portal protein n=1 Tax=Mycobacterium phage Kumao TaxID=2041344 RepID=A0A2D1GPM7_9CAUD|nr:portal protein [Mycobacterium phage Kumao]ATN93977.1 portal protein [Mycobacterium phage Kumao]
MTQVRYYTDDLFIDIPRQSVSLPPDNMTERRFLKYLNHEVMPAFETERDRLQKLEAWAKGKQPEVKPLKRNTERAVLQRLARTPWVNLMINTFAQQLIVDGYRREGEKENQEAWRTWIANNMQSQQIALNRATSTFGYAYLRCTEGVDHEGNIQAVMRGASPLRTFALYEDYYADEFPIYTLEKRPDGTYRWWTPEEWVDLSYDGKFKILGHEAHDYGLVPFVRYKNQIDLEGHCWGDVEPIIDLAARIDKTGFDRLLVQHFNSFKVRWATGLEQPDSEQEVEQEKIRIANEDILISSEAQARFGTLDETQLTGFIEAYKCDLEAFCAVNQLPPSVIGPIVNVAAEALAAGNRQSVLKLTEKQVMMGASHNQALRLTALIEGRLDDANDFSASVTWQDVEVRSLAQVADAWGKIVDQLGVPKWAAWDKIPGVTQSEVQEWKNHALDNDPLSVYLRDMGIKPAGQNGGPGGPNTTRNQPRVSEEEANV